ncbi:hypothetical protein [Limnothrix redekei]|uniref:Uncharacterized protein n=1 Tax=Limnothrix redekei LRLZ20PSL1 TaxID=3112953 RepID=A0ABW7CIL2_9CYAN
MWPNDPIGRRSPGTIAQVYRGLSGRSRQASLAEDVPPNGPIGISMGMMGGKISPKPALLRSVLRFFTEGILVGKLGQGFP